MLLLVKGIRNHNGKLRVVSSVTTTILKRYATAELRREEVVTEAVMQGSPDETTKQVNTIDATQEIREPAAQSSSQPRPSTSQPETRRSRLKNPSLPIPRFIGKRRQPVDVSTALQEVKAGSKCKFDETVDIVMHLGTDAKRGDQQVRGAVVLPHGTGKSVRVCVFAEGEAAEIARQSGADLVGSEDILAKVKEGEIDFDKCLATADMMPRLSKVARILGPRGLMPSPKLGTLVDTSNLLGAIKQMKGGRVEYRADKTANVHAGIGKMSFPAEHLYNNLGVFAGAILNARPKGVKGTGFSGYILSVHLSSTMGRGVPVTVASVAEALQKANRL